MGFPCFMALLSQFYTPPPLRPSHYLHAYRKVAPPLRMRSPQVCSFPSAVLQKRLVTWALFVLLLSTLSANRVDFGLFFLFYFIKLPFLPPPPAFVYVSFFIDFTPSFLAAQAGGAGSDGKGDILDIHPTVWGEGG